MLNRIGVTAMRSKLGHRPTDRSSGAVGGIAVVSAGRDPLVRFTR